MKNVYLCQPQYGVDLNKLSYYLPYSAACLWSYVFQFEDIKKNFHLKELIFRREKFNEVLSRIQDPAIFGFSCYLWNERYCMTLAHMVKEKWPDCLIVVGGPQASGKMIKHDFIDSIVISEGEESFLEILRSTLQGKTPEKFYSKKRLQNLDIPSPYTTGVFDDIMSSNPDVLWSMTFETNRGCPYSCTFCDWGGLTYSKVKKFDIERIKEDIEWATKWPVNYLFCADANFGIFKERDIEIAKMIRGIHGRSKIDRVNLQYAKNSTEAVFEIARIIGPLSRGVTLSVQSMNEVTLDAIKRGNMDTNNIKKLIELSKQYGVFTYTEVILGLPLETIETWKQGLADILEMGQHQSIDMWFGQLLENSELNSAESRSKYGVKSIIAKDYMPFLHFNDDQTVHEEIELINETSTMSTDDIVEAYMYGWMIIHMHIGGYSQILARYCRSFHDISYRDFYDRMFEKIKASPILGEHYSNLRKVVHHYLTTGHIDDDYCNKGGHGIHSVSYEYFFQRQGQIKSFASDVARSFVDIDPSVEILNSNFLFSPEQDYPLFIDLEFDPMDWKKEKSRCILSSQLLMDENFDFYKFRRQGLIKNKIAKA
jgi:putative methyltransferase